MEAMRPRVPVLSSVAAPGSFRRSVGILVGAAGLAQVMVVVSSPLLTRLYSPADLGVYASAAAVLAILVTTTCLRYELAIPLPESDQVAADVLAVAALTAVIVTGLTAVVAWLAGPALLDALGAEQLGPFVWLLLLGQLSGALILALTGWAVRTKAFGDIAATRLSQSGSLVVTQLGLGLLGLHAVGLLVGDVAGRVAGGGRLFRSLLRTGGSAIRSISPRGMRAAAVRYRRFPLFSSWSAVLNAIGLQAPLLYLVVAFGTEAGGHLALAQRIGQVPITLLAGAVGQVFVAQAAQLARDDPVALRRLFIRTTRSLSIIGAVAAVAFVVLAPTLAVPIFGADWQDAGLFVAILAPTYLLQLVANPLGGALDVLERQDLHLVREVARLAFFGVAILVAVALEADVIGTVVALSAAGCAAYACYALLSWRAILQHERRPTAGPFPPAPGN
jgi:O-antigen/teichoic acid export membrane protein